MFFASPQYILLILFVPVFILLSYFEYQRNEKIFTALGDLNIVKKSSILPKPISLIIRGFFFTLGWFFLTLALMNPQGNPHYPPGLEGSNAQEKEQDTEMKAQEIIFLVDESASMDVLDGRLGKSRLDTAKDIIEEIVRGLNGEHVSLYTFSNELERKIATTIDYFYFRLHLREVGKNKDRGGTSLVKAVSDIVREMMQKKRSLAATIILFSDGEETLGGDNQSIWDNLAKNSKDAVPFRIFTVGIGSEDGGVVPNVQYHGKPVNSKLEKKILQEIASAFKGKFYQASAYTPYSLANELLQAIRSSESFKLKPKTKAEKQSLPILYDLYFQIPLALAILFFFLYLFMPLIPRIKPKFLIWFLFFSSSLSAQENKYLPRARNYAEAKKAETAASILENQRNQEKEEWKKAILKYNQAASYMISKNRAEARRHLLEVPLGQEPFPPLAERVKTNEALIAIEGLMAVKKRALERGEWREADFYEAEAFYNHFMETIKEAENMDCQVQKLKGRERCKIKPLFQDLKNKAKELHFEIRNTSLIPAFEKMPLTDVALRLLGAIKRINSRLFHIQKSFSTKERDELISIEVEHAETLLPFWDLYSSRLSTLKNDSKASALVGLKAKDAYNQFLEALSQYDLDHAITNLTESSKLLRETLKLSFDGSQAIEALNVLLETYEALIEEGTLHIGSLQALLELQEESFNNLQEQGLQLKDLLEKSTKLLRESILNLSEEHPKMSQFYFYGAESYLELFIYKSANIKISPKDILIKLLKLSWSFRELYRLYDTLSETKEPNQILWDIFSNFLSLMDDFDTAVFELQKQRFADEEVEGVDRCQSVPWDEVNQAFNHGRSLFLKSSQSMKPLIKNRDDLLFVDQGIMFWKEALDLIDHPKGTNSCKGGSKKKEKSEEPSKSEEPKPSDQQTEDILRNLMEMEKEDAGFKQELLPPPKGVEKPW